MSSRTLYNRLINTNDRLMRRSKYYFFWCIIFIGLISIDSIFCCHWCLKWWTITILFCWWISTHWWCWMTFEICSIFLRRIINRRSIGYMSENHGNQMRENLLRGHTVDNIDRIDVLTYWYKVLAYRENDDDQNDREMFVHLLCHRLRLDD